MPTYQYRCTECGEDLEAVQKFSDPAFTSCPTCGGPLRKVFNAVGVVFKGSGFYRTDSRNGSKGGADADADSGTDKKVETKSVDREPAGAGSTPSNGSSKGKQPVSSAASSTGSNSADN
jgi:putative FmdB family regulatory protein